MTQLVAFETDPMTLGKAFANLYFATIKHSIVFIHSKLEFI